MGPAFLLAYIDPMSGSLAIQCLIAVAAGATFFFRRVLFRPLSFVSRLFGGGRQVATVPQETPAEPA